MYKFTSYKLILDILAVHGSSLPVSVDNSTLWRWRSKNYVPPEQWLLAYYFCVRAVKDFNDTNDLQAALDALGYDTDGLL